MKKFNELYEKYINLTEAPKKHVNMFRKNLDEIPSDYENKTIDGDFNVAQNNLKNLKNSPRIVNGLFSANNNDLTTLNGAPKEVSTRLSVDNNPNLKKLTGVSETTCKTFTCANCGLTDLTGLPHITGTLDASNNPLKSLKGLEKNKMYGKGGRTVKGVIKLTGTGFKRPEIEKYCEEHGIKYDSIQD